MSVVGIDFGNTNCVVAIAQRGGIDVIANEVSNRLTPCMISFGEKERYIGEAAQTQWLRNVKNTPTDMKRLLGRTFQEPDVQREVKRAAYKVVDSNGKIGAQVMYANESQTFTMEALVGMVLGKLKRTAEEATSIKAQDVVISVPGWWTDAQRRALLNASEIAGLNCLRIMNETAAVALGYGIYKTDLPEKDPIKVMFVDVGESSTSVSVVAFQKGQLRVLSTAYDPQLGGRDFDEVLVEHFAKEFVTKYKINVKENPKALIRLRAQCEKVKKILSSNPEAPLNIDSLMDDKDVRSNMDRKTFEDLSAALLSRVVEPVKRALEESGVKAEELFAVEAVGGGSRFGSVNKRLSEFLGRDISRTLNSEEAVARGCALQCAMLSPVFKVREFTVNDITSYPIQLSWKYVGGSGSEDSAEVFSKNNLIPAPKMITFNRADSIELTARYNAHPQFPSGHPTEIGTFKITNIPQTASADPSKVKVKVKLDIHGIFSVENAQFVETLPEQPDQPMAEAAEKKEETKEGDAKDAKEATEEKKKAKVKRVDVPVTANTAGFSTKQLNEAVEEEGRMAASDLLAIETADRKNALESYVYSMRSRLTGDLANYALEADKSKLLDLLNKAEDWLYGEGEDVTKSAYAAKLDEVKKLGDPIAFRFREMEERPDAIKALVDAILHWQTEVTDTTGKYDHIEKADKDKILTELDAQRAYLSDARAKQDSAPTTADPILKTADLQARKVSLEKLAKPILSRPKPAPKPAPAPTPAAGEEKKEEKAEEKAQQPETAEKSESAGPSAMDVD